MHDRRKVENQSSIHSGIPTHNIKHVPVITLGTEQQYIYIYIYIYPTLSSGSSLFTEHSKGGIQNSHTKLQLKEKEVTTSSQDITSSIFSTKVDPTIQIG